jgi:hypothetical protein
MSISIMATLDPESRTPAIDLARVIVMTPTGTDAPTPFILAARAEVEEELAERKVKHESFIKAIQVCP